MNRQIETTSQQRLTRRRFLQGLVGLSIAGVTGTACLKGFRDGVEYVGTMESGWLSVERVPIVMPKLAESERLVIAQLSDFHLGPFTTLEQVWQAIELTNRLQPDVIVVTGDYVTGSKAGEKDQLIEMLVEPLIALDSPGGVFAILGNHDYWRRGESVNKALTAAGIRLLRNDGLEIAPGLWLAGLEDAWVSYPDPGRALAGSDERHNVIIMVHEPDYADTLIRFTCPAVKASTAGRDVFSLQLSGHTHGGQVRIPGVGAPKLPNMGQRYPIGLQEVADSDGCMQVYTNRGIGVWPLPYRFNCPPEITLLEIYSDAV